MSRILDGSLLTVVCPACATELRLELPIVVTTESGSLALVPETDRHAFLAGELEYVLPDADRVAVGFAELAEKVRVALAGLDDAAIEVLKYYLMSRALEEADDEQEDHPPHQARSTRSRRIAGHFRIGSSRNLRHGLSGVMLFSR